MLTIPIEIIIHVLILKIHFRFSKILISFREMSLFKIRFCFRFIKKVSIYLQNKCYLNFNYKKSYIRFTLDVFRKIVHSMPFSDMDEVLQTHSRHILKFH